MERDSVSRKEYGEIGVCGALWKQLCEVASILIWKANVYLETD